jgi:hypothetical protein
VTNLTFFSIETDRSWQQSLPAEISQAASRTTRLEKVGTHGEQQSNSSLV